MGASLVYLEKPNKEVEFDLGENSNLKFAAGGMQGWRINMVSNGMKTNLSEYIYKRNMVLFSSNYDSFKAYSNFTLTTKELVDDKYQLMYNRHSP